MSSPNKFDFDIAVLNFCISMMTQASMWPDFLIASTKVDAGSQQFDILGPQALLTQSNMTVPALNKMTWIPLQSISLSQWETQVYLEGCWIVFWSIASSAPHPQACIQASDIWAKICTGDSSTPAIRFEQFKFASNSVHHWGRPEAAMACSEEKGKTMAMRTGLWILCSTPKTDVWPGGPHSKQNLVWRYVDCLIHSS